MGLCRIQVIGNLGNDAVVNNAFGKNVVNFTLCYSNRYKNSQGVDVTDTLWMSCAYWVEKTGISQYLKKGTQIFIEGTPEVTLYTNKEGKTVPQLKVRVSNIQLLSKSESSNITQVNSEDIATDLPF